MTLENEGRNKPIEKDRFDFLLSRLETIKVYQAELLDPSPNSGEVKMSAL